jgi:hypothetical protein
MTPEEGGLWISKLSSKGTPRYAEGRINGRKYEQGTLSESVTNPTGKVRNILNHTVDKDARVAVVYDKHGKLTKVTVQEGIDSFLRHGHNKDKVESVFVVFSNNGLLKYDL